MLSQLREHTPRPVKLMAKGAAIGALPLMPLVALGQVLILMNWNGFY